MAHLTHHVDFHRCPPPCVGLLSFCFSLGNFAQFGRGCVKLLAPLKHNVSRWFQHYQVKVRTKTCKRETGHPKVNLVNHVKDCVSLWSSWLLCDYTLLIITQAHWNVHLFTQSEAKMKMCKDVQPIGEYYTTQQYYLQLWIVRAFIFKTKSHVPDAWDTVTVLGFYFGKQG